MVFKNMQIHNVAEIIHNDDESKNTPMRMNRITLVGVSNFDMHIQRKGFFINKRDAFLMLPKNFLSNIELQYH